MWWWSDSYFGPSKTSRVKNNSTIDKNDNDIEDITTSSNDLSIQSSGNSDIKTQVQGSDEADDPSVQRNILPEVKSKFQIHP